MNSAVGPGQIDIVSMAAAFREAESSRRGIAPITGQYANLTIEDAYAVQRANIEHRVSRGERVVGRKIGLTSLAMQQQLGVDQPDYGAITDAMEIADGSVFDPAELLQPRIEAEFAFEIGADMPISPSYEELVAAVSGVAVAMEIIDSRVTDWKIRLLDTIADNASMARVVWGEFVPATPGLLARLPEAVVSLTRDGDAVSIGPGSAVLGHPLISLNWLTTAIGALGDRLRAGDRVLAGAVAGAVSFSAGSTWAIHSDGLPTATLISTPISITQAETGGTE